MFYINEEWTKRSVVLSISICSVYYHSFKSFFFSIFLNDPMYATLLTHKSYHNLDEGGLWTRKEFIVNHGEHSIAQIATKILEKRGYHYNRGRTHRDRLFMDLADSITWSGPVRWFQGNWHIYDSTFRILN